MTGKDPAVIEPRLSPQETPMGQILEELWTARVVDVASLGEGYRLLKRDTVNFSEEFALTLVDDGPDAKILKVPFDRPITQRHVEYLGQAMRQGTFLWEDLSIDLCSCNGKVYRLNGQHTAWARIYWKEAPHNLPVTVKRYFARTENDMRILYANKDRAKTRTKGNVVCAYLFGNGQFEGVTRHILERVAQGFSFWMFGIDKDAKRSGDADAALMQREYLDLALRVCEYYGMIQSEGGRHLQRAPVVGALFETFRKHHEESITFWNAVKHGSNLSLDDPRLKLRNHLMLHAVNAGRGGGSYKKNVSGEEMFSWCIQAWNAVRNNKPLRHFTNAKPGFKRTRAV